MESHGVSTFWDSVITSIVSVTCVLRSNHWYTICNVNTCTHITAYASILFITNCYPYNNLYIFQNISISMILIQNLIKRKFVYIGINMSHKISHFRHCFCLVHTCSIYDALLYPCQFIYQYISFFIFLQMLI